MGINGYELVKTCGACPEQYEVYKDGVEVAYLRLRSGIFTVDVCDETVYLAHPRGDGMFCDDEREFYLKKAIEQIDLKLGCVDFDSYKLIRLLEELEEFVDRHSEGWYRSGQKLLSDVRSTIKDLKDE